MILFIPGAANCGDRNVTLATMANVKNIKHTQCWIVPLLVRPYLS